MQHYYWAGGHGLMFFTGLRYLLAWVFFKSSGLGYWYKAAFTGAFLSYLIVVKKSLGMPGGSAWATRALADENFQYFILSLFWLISKPVGIALIPFWTFSAFHVATFARTAVVPKFFPPTPNPNGGSPQASPIAKGIQTFVKMYYDPSMKLVAYVELAIFARVFFGLFLRQNSLLMPIVYAVFLRSRYFHSLFTRQAFNTVDAYTTNFLTKQAPQGLTYYNTFKGQLGRAMGTVLVPAETGGQAAAGASAGKKAQ